LELDQLLGDIGAFLQLGVCRFQALKLLVAGIGGLASGLAGGDAGLTVLGQILAPSRQLTGIQPLAAQPGTLLAMRQGIGLGQQTLLLSDAEAASGTLLKARVGDNFVGIRHLFTPQAP